MFDLFSIFSREGMDLGKILETLELDNIVEMELEDNTLNVNINGDENRLGILIGKRGVTLDSIQYILNLIVNKKSSRYILSLIHI